MNDVYTFRSILAPTEGFFKDRGSKFLAYAYPISSPEEVKQYLNDLKKMHPKAVHHCYAYRIGVDNLAFRANDDGEPSGSAGKPILGQIDSFNLTNVLVVVVRYFGGTLLGVPGLINAYKSATAECLSIAEVVEKNIEKLCRIKFEYNLLNDVMHILKTDSVNIIHQEMLLFCEFEIGIPLSSFEQTKNRLSNIHGVELTLKA